jgi:hypothetical protein
MVIIRLFKNIKNIVNLDHWAAYYNGFIVISPPLIEPIPVTSSGLEPATFRFVA